MIKVTTGEKPQSEVKPFPRLMKHKDGTITLLFLKETGIHLVGFPEHIEGELIRDIKMDDYSDYNAPVTIQNA